MAHVFIVSEKTLPIHLKYKFAGTGAKDLSCEFLFNNDIEINWARENLLCGMIADISRIRIGDKVIFYLLQTDKHDGMFFGSFKVKGKPFLSNDDYLKDELGKNLTFRVELEPDEVYSKGITERECLDSLENIHHPSELCWSLIYRKLKANRGCTMITDFEYNKIMDKIRSRNKNITIDGLNFSYDNILNEITKDNISHSYCGIKESLKINSRLIYKKQHNRSYEVHLQDYILQNLENISILNNNNIPITWIGNEVSCGVGMQSMDICFCQETKNELNIMVCELKDEQPIQHIFDQLRIYINWIIEYIIPTYKKRIKIYPIIIAPKPKEKVAKMFTENKSIFECKKNNYDINKIRYIYFDETKDNNLTFNEEG